MEERNHCMRALNSDTGRAFGVWQMLPNTYVSRALAVEGVHWILVDCEHGNIDDSAMHEVVQAIASCGVSPIVRIPGTDGWLIKRALDAGAHGLMVPLLRSVKEAEQVVQHSKFPPHGIRGLGSPFAMHAFRGQPTINSAEYLRQANQSLLTVIQIETAEALEYVEEIAKVPGVDVLFAGPFDLANSLGLPVEQGVHEPQLRAALDRILAAAESAGKKAGIYCSSANIARECSNMGFHMVSCMTDATTLPAMARQSLDEAQGER